MLALKRNDDESWRDCVERIAEKYGLELECLESFDNAIEDGLDEEDAAFDALYEWDCLEYVE